MTALIGKNTFAGSSPPARGTHRGAGAGRGGARFIPACAGNTRWACLANGRAAVHPRLRGEHLSSARAWEKVFGSSPPARGTQDGPLRFVGDSRFIPACAGNTGLFVASRGLSAVHPRLRGEHMSPGPKQIRFHGSSPPARGTLFTESVVPQSFLQCQKTHRPIGTPAFQFRSPPCTRATQRFRDGSPAVRGCGGRRSGKRGSTRRRLPSSQSERRRLCRSQARSRIASI